MPRRGACQSLSNIISFWSHSVEGDLPVLCNNGEIRENAKVILSQFYSTVRHSCHYFHSCENFSNFTDVWAKVSINLRKCLELQWINVGSPHGDTFSNLGKVYQWWSRRHFRTAKLAATGKNVMGYTADTVQCYIFTLGEKSRKWKCRNNKNSFLRI